MKRFKNILLVYDRRVANETTITRATELARRNEARLTFVEVIEDLPSDLRLLVSGSSRKSLEETFLEERAERLKRMAVSIDQAGVEVETKVLVGTPFLEIAQEAMRNDRDLVILSAEGRGGLKNLLFGSTSMHLMRKCPTPVWVVKPSAERQHYKSILACVDPGAAESKDALNVRIMDLAKSLAELEGARLHVVHAWELAGNDLVTSKSELPAGALDEIKQKNRELHAERLGGLLERFDLKNLDHEVHLVEGDPRAVISELAQSQSADLIVMGTVSRTGIPGLLIGNIAEEVLIQAECSVLTLKPDGFRTPIEVADYVASRSAA